MGPIRSLVILADRVRRSIKSVTSIAVKCDFAADGVLGPSIRPIASIVQTMWWTARWIVCSKSYLQRSNCNQENACKRLCHLKFYTTYSYRWLHTCIEKTVGVWFYRVESDQGEYLVCGANAVYKKRGILCTSGCDR